MGQKELLLTIGAITIFALVSLSVNRHILINTDAIYGRQAEFYAAKLAQRFIEEAKVKAFDESTINNTPSNIPNDFSSLGPGGSESYPNFDDVDDFNGFSTTVATKVGPMTVNIAVAYVNETNLDSVVTSKTYYKRMTVTTQSDYLNAPVTMRYVFAFQKNP